MYISAIESSANQDKVLGKKSKMLWKTIDTNSFNILYAST